MTTQIASALDDRNQVVTRDAGTRGSPGADGIDGSGFDQVDGNKIENPILSILAPNQPAVAGAQFLQWLRDSEGRGFNKYGQLASANIDQPRETKEGYYIEAQGTNLLLNSDSLSTQSITVANDSHTLSFFGTGTVTLSGVFSGSLVGTGANDRVTLNFTPGAGTLTVTVTGTVDYAQIEQSPFATSYITSDGAEGLRAPDIVTTPAFNNCPLLDEDFTIFFKVYFDGFTGLQDFIFCLPNGVNDDNLTVCGFCDSGTLTLRISDGTTSADCTHTISAETQYSVAFRKSATEIKLEVDGVNVSTTAHSITLPTDQDSTIKIGGNIAGEAKNMHGKIYNFRIYDSLLNDDESVYLSGV